MQLLKKSDLNLTKPATVTHLNWDKGELFEYDNKSREPNGKTKSRVRMPDLENTVNGRDKFHSFIESLFARNVRWPRLISSP